ncbi:thioredoxin domain-containing protein [Ancylomarina sp. YFZ004]
MNSYDQAKEIAKEQNKLIIVDCWANWCGPCVKMDDEVWSSEIINAYADSFIFVKIDLSSSFSHPNFTVKAIPKIFITDAWNSQMKDYTGYQSKSRMNNILKSFNFDISEIYNAKEGITQNKKDFAVCLELAMTYQKISIGLERDACTPIRYLSMGYFKKAIKESKNRKDIRLTEQAIILSCLNKNSKKTIKILQKLKSENNNNLILKHAVLAKAYFALKDIKTAKMYLDKVKSEELPYYDFLEEERSLLN